jgi:cyanophycin synthetase
MAPDGSLVVVLPESVNRAIKLIKMRGVQEETQPQQSTHNDSQNGVASSSAINTLI